MRPLLLIMLCLVAWAGDSRPDPRQAAAELDALILADLAAAGTPALGEVDEWTLLRRTWLDLAGRIPTVPEVREWMADTGPNRPARLAERLIGSPAWNQALFSWLADLLRVQSRLQDRIPGQAWIDWLRQAVATNQPWDAFVRAQLTATGHAFSAAEQGVTGFILRDAGMPLDHAAVTAQTFLGTRIGCAQCHDHPYDRWTRREFTSFAAFSADARTELGPGRGFKDLKPLVEAAEAPVRNAARVIGTLIGARVSPAKKDWLAAPADWQYPDAKPGDRIPAQALFAPGAPVASGDPRQRLATWMTSPANERFALAIGNRVWKRVFGHGLIEPVDDIRFDPDQPLPALPARLARLVVEQGFDLQRIHLALVLTTHWRRATWHGEVPVAGGVVPGRPALRLSATAWWDSLVAICADQPDAASATDASPLFALHQQISDPAAVLAAAKRLAALRSGGGAAMKADPEMAAAAQIVRGQQRRRPNEALVRAASLPQPAPVGHPLRILGQSDRELIDNASTQPTVTQALLLMNGLIDNEVLARHSRLRRDLEALREPAAQAEHLWLALLSRPPRADERDLAVAEIQARGRDGLFDLVWGLGNSSAFRLVR
jgi:hypothetical protein